MCVPNFMEIHPILFNQNHKYEPHGRVDSRGSIKVVEVHPREPRIAVENSATKFHGFPYSFKKKWIHIVIPRAAMLAWMK